ncbi:MAG: hypothetical protein HYV15_07080 [Elusimicrobia bacterium]|nr:hypothetical protein [Elusimicrobiota bacterium]
MKAFALLATARYLKQAAGLPAAVRRQLAARHEQLAENPRHPSLRTHPVEGAVGDHGGKVFEAYVSEKYRLTWEYGPVKGELTLRNVDNHDECLGDP